jgi:hypothetical protein
MLLDRRRILFIGMPANALPASPYKFFDMFNVDEFKLIAWDAETFVADIQEKTGQPFDSYHHPFVYRRFKELYDEKLSQILSWTRDGHVLVIFPFSFNSGLKTDGASGVVNVDINHFPPFNLISLASASGDSLNVVDDFSDQFSKFVDILRYNLVFSGEDIIPLFRTGGVQQDRSGIAGAAFRVGKGAIVFSPLPKTWHDPKMVEYFDTLAKLPHLLNRPLDPSPEWTGAFQRTAALAAMITAVVAFAVVAFSPFWAPQVAQLLPWGEKPSADGRDYSALAARLTELEKRPVSPSFNLDAIKSAEDALTRRVDTLEMAVSHMREQSVAQQPKAVAAPLPAASARLSSEEIAELLARGDALFRTGDVASARLFYERAASGGDGRSALRLGATFDPALLDRDPLRGVRGDLAEAHIWYQRARDLGEAEAERRLKSLETKEGEKSP